jgi:hypothetical protein
LYSGVTKTNPSDCAIAAVHLRTADRRAASESR